MLLTIAKWILIMAATAFLVTALSVAVWAIKEVIRWLRKEGRKR